ncbi:hypothetical protein [Pontiella sulfatireligans]|uniref:Uncharacterized protein n=1 Tax=Pontiella sulfatireligans TaxID=2750658 RepID=A0A6C2UM37_9BACT|nr:hypothetical protein [Pontiella sulfatireligans]VGO20176.1 hypothetical protein SCARR_02237 [Pontiella sulfatireligans]
MKKTMTAVAVLGIAVSVIAVEPSKFGGSISVYDVKIKGNSLKLKSAKKNVLINDQKLKADKYAEDSDSLSGVIISYQGANSFLTVDEKAWEQGYAELTFGIDDVIAPEEVLETGAAKLSVEGVASNGYDVVSQKGRSAEYFHVELESMEFWGNLLTRYKVELKEQKGVVAEKISMNASGSGDGEIRVYRDEEETKWEWFGAVGKGVKVKYNSKVSDEWSAKYDNALSVSNEAYAVAVVNALVNSQINEKTGGNDAAFKLDYAPEG